MISRFCQLRQGMRIHFFESGPRDAPPLVLLHGYPGNALLWRDVVPLLAGDFRVLAPDLPGHGRSDKPLEADYTKAFLVDFLDAFLDALRLPRVDLVGHDLGGVTALGFSAAHADRVLRLAVLNTAPYADWSPTLHRVVRDIRHPLKGRLLLWRPLFHRALRRLLFGRLDRVSEKIIEDYRRPWVADAGARRAFRHIVAPAPKDVGLTPAALAQIIAPTLILWGDRDPMMGTDVARRLSGDVRGATLRLVHGCGHFLQEDDPVMVGRELSRFFSGKERRSCTAPSMAS
ncbi:MAG: alpha/beta fold hydrolase [Pseudomonadota bacterium]